MRQRVDPIGRLLLRSGDLSEDALADVLDNQRHTLPFASLCYVLGHADEETLTRALSKQSGMPGVVLDKSIIQLDALDGFHREHALRYGMLPVFEDDRRVFVATRDPTTARDLLRELEFVKGKAVVQHIALHVTLARTIRGAYEARRRGEPAYRGPAAGRAPTNQGVMFVVSDVDSIPPDGIEARAHDALVGDITKEILDDDLVDIIEASDVGEGSTVEGMTPVHAGDYAEDGRMTTATPLSQIELAPQGDGRTINLDEGDAVEYRARHDGPPHVLIVDDDFATRHLLVKVLQPTGYMTTTASSGSESVNLIKSEPPDLVVIDVMLPEIDGFQICRAIKSSRRYKNIAVILMSAVIDSGRVTDEVLKRYGADAYFEKPINTDRVVRRIEDLLGRRKSTAEPIDDGSFERALDLYRTGKVDAAMALLRAGLQDDPLSAKHHFVLANLLQKKSLIYEAIDEYEATVDLKPDYFPALTRLAYLYYKKGFSVKAIEMWRRSLPHCPDATLRQNIEVFMRKLIAGMQAQS
jgi:DNA-binding response OmpR family regulator